MRTRFLACLLSLLTLAACTAKTPVVDPTASSLPPSLSPSPTVRPEIPKAVRAAVTLDGSLYVYEVATDVVTEVAAGGLRDPHWLGRTSVAAVHESAGQSIVNVIDTAARTTTELIRVEGVLRAYDVRDDGAIVGTITERDGLMIVELRYLVGDRAVQRITTMPVEGRTTGPEEQVSLRFSPDGERVLVVQTANVSGSEETAPLQVRRLDGSLEYFVDASREPGRAVWLPTGALVFSSLDGVRRWRPGKSSSVGVSSVSGWYSPWPSPAGSVVAYDTGRFSRRVQVRTVALSNGRVRDVGPAGRANPVFVAPNEVWTQNVQRCEPECEAPVVLSQGVFATRLGSGAERQLALPTLDDLALWAE